MGSVRLGGLHSGELVLHRCILLSLELVLCLGRDCDGGDLKVGWCGEGWVGSGEEMGV